MNNYLLKKYNNQFREKALKIDSYTRNKLGIQQRNTFLKSENYYIYCSPYELFLSSCNVLLIMKDNEIKIFSQKEGKKCRFHLQLENKSQINSKASFYIWTSYKVLKKIDEDNNIWLIKLDFIYSPPVYQEMLINIFLSDEILTSYYNDPSKNNLYFDTNTLKIKKIRNYVVINQKPYLIFKISMKKVLIVSDSKNVIVSGSKIEAEFKYQNVEAAYVEAVVEKVHTTSSADKYVIELNLGFSPYVVGMINSII